MFGSGDEQASKSGWVDIDDSLSETGTESVLEQLSAMDEAEVVYPDGTSYEWEEGLEENYMELVDGFGGEDEVSQYMEIEGTEVTVAVEHGEETVFTVYADEERYGKDSGLNLGLASPL